MAYQLPQVLVFQDFQASPVAALNPLRAHISGGHAWLVRYAQDDEQALGLLGAYDNIVDTDYEWPNQPAGSLIDQSYTKIWMKNALLQYFSYVIGQGDGVAKVADYNNRVRAPSISFAANGDDYPRDDLFFDRDVVPGDIAKVRGIDGDGDPVTRWTYVKRLIPDPIAAVVAASTSDANNEATQSASSSASQTHGPFNCVGMTIDASDYNGLPDGSIDETYEIIITGGSGNEQFDDATARVISGSGLDDQASVSISAEGVPTAIGTRGLEVTFSITPGGACSASASEETVSPVDLAAGQRWLVTVHQAFTKPVPTSGGDYDGDASTIYLVTVDTGGRYTDAVQPTIKVATSTGIDLSGPTTVTGANTFVAVGTEGVLIKFTGTALRAGDRYYISVEGVSDGPYNTIELGHNLDTTIADGSEVDITLYILRPLLQIAQNRTGFAPLQNWDTTSTEITVNSSIIAYDPTWTDGGVPLALDVLSDDDQEYGILYVEYRAWLSTLCSTLGSVDDVATLNSSISGALDPDNPLKWGVFQALQNSNGVDVKYTSVCDPDDAESWADVLTLLLGHQDVYGLVPLTKNQTILNLYAAHIGAQSSPEEGMWRVMWTNLYGVPEIPIVADGSTVANHVVATTTDGEPCLATIDQDPNTDGDSITRLICTSDNGAFITNGVTAGMIVRALFTGDGFGSTTYTEYVIASVVSNDEVLLSSGPDLPITVGSKIEIWSVLNADQEAAEIAQQAGAWSDRRVRAVWPDQITSSGTVMDGMFLCCALAGLASGILPHQGMTNLTVAGYTDVSRTVGKFGRGQLDVMGGGGVWIVTQNIQTGAVYTRQAVTTAPYADVNQREEMVTRNVDSISFRFQDYFAPFIGITNVTPVIQARLSMEVGKLVSTLKTENNTVNLGPQLIDAVVISGPDQSLILPDRYVMTIAVALPVPFNNFELHLLV